MIKDMRISEHPYNCSDRKEDYDRIHARAKKKTTDQTASKSRYRYASGITYKKVQKVRQAQLSLCPGTRSRKLLSFSQYAWQKSYHDLCLFQKSRQDQKSLSQLSNSSKHFGRYQYAQSRSFSAKGNFIERKLWPSKWKPPP
jgi:hypothetical protein